MHNLNYMKGLKMTSQRLLETAKLLKGFISICTYRGILTVFATSVRLMFDVLSFEILAYKKMNGSESQNIDGGINI